jgi:small-conductance mechanosensitive channel
VQVSGVSGEVVEIGMIRLHVMELSGAGADAQPTGRVVAFSNSIVFQPTAGLFKQVPGASFMWHEISITLAPDSNYQEVERRMLGAVDAAFKDYQKDFEALRRQVEKTLSSISVASLVPKVRFKLTQTGLEVVVRFPVETQKAAEVDDRVTRHLLQAIEQEPKLKVVGADVPTIRLKTDTHAAEASPA